MTFFTKARGCWKFLNKDFLEEEQCVHTRIWLKFVQPPHSRQGGSSDQILVWILVTFLPVRCLSYSCHPIVIDVTPADIYAVQVATPTGSMQQQVVTRQPTFADSSTVQLLIKTTN